MKVNISCDINDCNNTHQQRVTRVEVAGGLQRKTQLIIDLPDKWEWIDGRLFCESCVQRRVELLKKAGLHGNR